MTTTYDVVVGSEKGVELDGDSLADARRWVRDRTVRRERKKESRCRR